MNPYRNDWLYLAIIFCLLLAGKAWLTSVAGLELHFDEAQYWTWSQFPDWSYATKGPLVAWLIGLSEGLFGRGEWQTRLPGWIAASFFPLLLFAFAREIWTSRTAGWWALLLAVTTPLFAILGLVVTTDIFLFDFWALGLWAAYRALIEERRTAWYGLGAATGLGVLTKLSIGLLPAVVGLWVLLHPDYRRHLRERHLWGGILLMLLIASPVLYWNAQHDWVMLRHNAGHIAQDGWSLLRLGEFMAGQWLVLSPLVVGFAVWRLWQRPAEPGQRFLWTISLGCLSFFLIKSLSTEVLLNWAAPVYIGFIVLFAGQISGFTLVQHRWLLVGYGLSLVLILATLFPAGFGLSEARTGLKKLRAWQAPVAQLAASAGPVDFVLAPDYRLASELWFYWPSPIRVYLWGNAGRRFNQYDIWAGPEGERGRNGLYVTERPGDLSWLGEDFASCKIQPPVEARTRDGGVARTLHAAHCENFEPKRRFLPEGF